MIDFFFMGLRSINRNNNNTNKDSSIIKQVNSTEFNIPINTNLNSSEIDLNNITLEEFLDNFKDHGQKYNTAIKYLSCSKMFVFRFLTRPLFECHV